MNDNDDEKPDFWDELAEETVSLFRSALASPAPPNETRRDKEDQ